MDLNTYYIRSDIFVGYVKMNLFVRDVFNMVFLMNIVLTVIYYIEDNAIMIYNQEEKENV
jgi:hypothetical protein